MSPLSRRQFIGSASGTIAAAWFSVSARDLLVARQHAAHAATAETLPPFEVLSAADAREIEAAAAVIVPTDDTPGAREARVIYFIDKSLATFAAGQRPAFVDVAKALRQGALKHGKQSFALLDEASQIKVLESIEKEKPQLFGPLRFGTIAGMVALPSYGGNYNKAGWKWMAFNDQFSWAAPFGAYDRK